VESLLTYAAAWVLGLVITILFLLASEGAPNGGWFFEFPGQLVGLGVFGLLSGGSTIFGISLSATVAFLPLVMTAMVVVGSVILARRNERALPTSKAQRWILSIANSVVFAIVTLVVALVLPIVSTSAAVPNPLFALPAITVTLSTASFTLVLGSIVIVTAASLLGRRSVAHSLIPVQPIGAVRRVIRATAPVSLLYTVVAGVIITVVGAIVLIAQGAASSLLSLPLSVPLVVANGLALVNFSNVGITGSGVPLLTSIGQFPTSIWLPSSAVPIWAVCLAVIVNLVLIALVGIALHLRRRVRATGSGWATTIVTFALLGVVLSLVGSISVWTHIDASGLSTALQGALGSGSSGTGGLAGLGSAALGSLGSIQLTFGPALWTFLAFAIVGALVEVSASYLAPAIAPAIPAGSLSATSRFLGRFGVPLLIAPETVESEDEAAAAPSTAAAPMSAAARKRLKLGLIVGGGVVAVVVLASVAIAILGSTVFAQDRQVRAYLDDIVGGHAAQAIRDGHISASGSTSALLTDSVLAHTKGRITSYTVTGTTTSGDQGTVTVQETQGGHASTVQYSLHKTGSVFLFFGDWKLDPVPVQKISAELSPGVTAIAINGATVSVSSAEQAQGVVEIPAFPGVYRLGLGGDTKWFTAKPETTTVAAGGLAQTNAVSIEARPSAALKTEVTSQVTTFLDACAAKAEISPSGCPFEYFGIGTVSHVKWKVASVPSLTIGSDDGKTWGVTSDAGEAGVSFDDDFFGETDHETDSTQYYVYGTISFATGSPVFTYNDGF
jgi:hypothetical protein